MMSEDINRRRLLKGIGLGTGTLAIPSTVSGAQQKDKQVRADNSPGNFEVPKEHQDPESVNPESLWGDRPSVKGGDSETNGYGNKTADINTGRETMYTRTAGAGAHRNPGAATILYTDFELADFHDEEVSASLDVNFNYEWESNMCDPGLSHSEEIDDAALAEKMDDALVKQIVDSERCS